MADITRRGTRPWWMTPFSREPWGDVFTDRLWPEWPRPWGEEYTPKFDLYEQEGKYVLEADLPGFDKDNISITLDQGVLTISGRQEEKREEKGERYFFQERTTGSFSRSIRLPAEVDPEAVEASLDQGVLKLILPAKGAPETRKITVK